MQAVSASEFAMPVGTPSKPVAARARAPKRRLAEEFLEACALWMAPWTGVWLSTDDHEPLGEWEGALREKRWSSRLAGWWR